jgi:hypothetical protein
MKAIWLSMIYAHSVLYFSYPDACLMYFSLKDMPFREEVEKIDEYWKKMTSWNTSIFVSINHNISGRSCKVACYHQHQEFQNFATL